MDDIRYLSVLVSNSAKGEIELATYRLNWWDRASEFGSGWMRFLADGHFQDSLTRIREDTRFLLVVSNELTIDSIWPRLLSSFDHSQVGAVVDDSQFDVEAKQVFSNMMGVFGINHRFMSLVVRSVPFAIWKMAREFFQIPRCRNCERRCPTCAADFHKIAVKKWWIWCVELSGIPTLLNVSPEVCVAFYKKFLAVIKHNMVEFRLIN